MVYHFRLRDNSCCNYIAKSMAASDYSFIAQVDNFDIDDYLAHLGWNAPTINYLKIYTRVGSPFFYLHDEIQDRLYEFCAADAKTLCSKEEFQCVVEAYRVAEIMAKK